MRVFPSSGIGSRSSMTLSRILKLEWEGYTMKLCEPDTTFCSLWFEQELNWAELLIYIILKWYKWCFRVCLIKALSECMYVCVFVFPLSKCHRLPLDSSHTLNVKFCALFKNWIWITGNILHIIYKHSWHQVIIPFLLFGSLKWLLIAPKYTWLCQPTCV